MFMNVLWNRETFITCNLLISQMSNVLEDKEMVKKVLIEYCHWENNQKLHLNAATFDNFELLSSFNVNLLFFNIISELCIKKWKGASQIKLEIRQSTQEFFFTVLKHQNILRIEMLIKWREGCDIILIRFNQTLPSYQSKFTRYKSSKIIVWSSLLMGKNKVFWVFLHRNTLQNIYIKLI